VKVERLIQKKGSSTGAEAELAQLVEACEPVVISDVHKRRSLSAVYSRHHERRRTVRFGLRAAMTAGVLLMAGAATAAVFGLHFKISATTPAPIVATPAPAVRHVARRAELAPLAELEAPAEPESPAKLEPPAPPAPPVHRARSLKSEDPSQVVSAIQALRQDRDPERAGRLLASYLRTHPRGALAEEAVALSIEAADARHSPAAVTFAERYLKEYPHGRFSSAAERALARPAL
jgi:hypothetical protein